MIDTTNIQSMSKVRVMRILSARKNCTRMDLAKATGLTPSAITRITADLISKGFIVEQGFGASESGRRTINLAVNKNAGKIMTVKLSRSYFNVTVWDLCANDLDNRHIEVKVSESQSSEIIVMIKSIAKETLLKYDDIRAIGITVPTAFYPGTRKMMAISDFLDWDGVDLVEILRSMSDLPILIENDANASAWAEWIYGAEGEEHGKGTLVSLIVADGIGIGVIQDSRILSSAFGTAGEIAHMSINYKGPKCACGNCGCLDLYASGAGFTKTVLEKLKFHPESTLNSEDTITTRIILEHMRKGDAFCREETKTAGEYIGYALANIMYMYNPDEIVLTGVMIGGKDVLFDAAMKILEERVARKVRDNCTIRFSSMGAKAPGIGAASLAMGLLFDDSES